jgi:predicted RNase H-like HicB family nuclease
MKSRKSSRSGVKVITALEPDISDRSRLSFSVLVEPDGDEFYAHCPAFKGIHVDGQTEEEAFRHAIQAVNCYIESMIRHGEPLPECAEYEVDGGTSSRRSRIRSRRYEAQWPSVQAHGTR